jgi:hypothetical protein
MSKEIGFSVSCYKGDLPLLRGCLASIRYFAQEAPICLVIDGDFDSRIFEKRYGATTIRRRDVLNTDLRQWSFGYGMTKLVALWESPFEAAIHIDADAVLWGDIRKNLPKSDWDFVFNEPHEEITEFIQKTQYFEPSFVSKHITDFVLQNNPYFNTGVFGFKRGFLDLRECLKLMQLRHANIEMFGAGDQGVLNILVFLASQRGTIKVSDAHLQSVVPVLAKSELQQRFRIENGIPVLWHKPTAIHWAGPKPYTTNPDVFSLPMDFFRELGMREFGLPGWVPAKAAMRADEFWHRDVPKAVLNAKSLVKRVIGRR